ncbi:MAG: XamI family restriction endonuclease [Gammaproteobacteria bacterium]|nr:XamI family restriction endonuclease [Gammaproteobacteria bacterium]
MAAMWTIASATAGGIGEPGAGGAVVDDEACGSPRAAARGLQPVQGTAAAQDRLRGALPDGRRVRRARSGARRRGSGSSGGRGGALPALHRRAQVRGAAAQVRVPPRRMSRREGDKDLEKIGKIIEKMADPDVFVWLERGDDPSDQELYRAATIVADRLCGAVANPIIRNAQEKRQLAAIGEWLTALGYKNLPAGEGTKYDDMKPGTFSYRLNVPVEQDGTEKIVNIPVDAVVMPKTAKAGDLPLLIEAKSAGDFTNVNKRRKEEAAKMNLLRRTYGDDVRYILFLCGYFDSGYLGYEAAEGIDWVREHRINDLGEFGL